MTKATTTTTPTIKRRRRTGRPNTTATKPGTKSKPLTPPTTTEIDHWFQSGPFSALPASATPAEIEADLKRIRASIARFANILLGAAAGTAVCEAHMAEEDEAEAVFERGASLSPRRGLSPDSTSAVSSVVGFAAEPLTPESFYGEEKDEGEKQPRKPSPPVNVDEVMKELYQEYTVPGNVRLRKLRRRF